jgi:SAM-dependent methyltransferase
MAPPNDAQTSITPGFENRHPTHQNALDILSGCWTSSFPALSGLVGGSTTGFFEDQRVHYTIQLLGTLSGRSILELGPYEGYNTYQFQQAGAASVISIESSKINFIKCLIVKNIFGLNATFLHGDFLTYLQETPCRFDICWASGVLYHMTRPIELIKAIKRVSDTVFLWSHYYDNKRIENSNNKEYFDSSNDCTHSEFSHPVRLHYRNYSPNHSKSLVFAGGTAPHSYWMEKEDIIFILNALGYQRIDLMQDDPDFPPGPAFSLLARV